ncbi:DNA-directed RNA polymerase III subunit C1 (rpo31) [Sporothrix eucalyptigena]
MTASSSTCKEQVVDKSPKRFKGLKFGIQSPQDILQQSVLEISDPLLFDIQRNRAIVEHGPLDSRLGLSSKTQGKCGTCLQQLAACPGHFGHIRLPLPVFHIGYFGFMVKILQKICKDCGRVLLDEKHRQDFLRKLQQRGLGRLQRAETMKEILEKCKECKTCPCCFTVNGIVAKVGTVKIGHDRYVTFRKSKAANRVAPPGKVQFDASFDEAKKYNPEIGRHLHRAIEDLNPLRVLRLFRKIRPSDFVLLGLDPLVGEGQPDMFLWQYVPAPPVCIRPSVSQYSGSTEDDLTAKLADIVHVCGILRTSLGSGAPMSVIKEHWDLLQLQLAVYINGELQKQLTPYASSKDKEVRGLSQRLKGKQGRFRGNLSGKRVDFSGRTVISPDPNLGIDEVAVPLHVATDLTYPERVTRINFKKIRERVRRGPYAWPGAKAVIKREADGIDGSYKLDLRFGDRSQQAKDLKVGDIVERHLQDGDVVLFNRQPSLHKLSIMAHRVKVRPWRTFRLNECVCTPYGADFDGDEMNLHVPQTEEARAEALTLMGVQYNLVTPKNGETIIAAIQDFITASYIISSKDRFFPRQEFTYLCAHMTGAGEHVDLPVPAILKPEALWTGKQVFDVLIRPNRSSNVLVNLEAKCKAFKPSSQTKEAPEMGFDDNYIIIQNSKVLCGRMDKAIVGSGKKDSLFYVILRHHGPDKAVAAMNRLARLCARYIGTFGVSTGVVDVFPTATLQTKMALLINDANRACDDLITQFNDGKLAKAPGCDLDQTLENAISGVLSRVRSSAGDLCLETLSKHNAPIAMASSGAKGLAINVAQMVAVVGQQIIGGQRVRSGFQDRSLPHYLKNSRQPSASGFVGSSFYSGLLPTEFFFHAMSGREGLVDTAVKTAETGYMSRRLMKSLEDLATQYDGSVRTSAREVVQFKFGDDGLDPAEMEGPSAVPVNFMRTWKYAENTTRDNAEVSLEPDEVVARCAVLLARERKKYKRCHFKTNAILDENNVSDAAVDLYEGAGAFLDSIQAFVQQRADYRQRVYKLLNNLDATDKVAKIAATTLETFVGTCLKKYQKAYTEPSHAVGSIGAQSIGEPGTQMTLKTFHFAGVAGMSITEGVPRINEIINASASIKTPIVTCPLIEPHKTEAARLVKNRIERTHVGDVLQSVEEEWGGDEGRLILEVDVHALDSLQLGLRLKDIAATIQTAKKIMVAPERVVVDHEKHTVSVVIRPGDPHPRRTRDKRENLPKTRPGRELNPDKDDLHERADFLRHKLPAVILAGIPVAARAVIQREGDTHTVYVEGSGLRHCINTDGVYGARVTSNDILETDAVLGIEAARTTIVREITAVMRDMNIDPRHMALLADVMTYKGQVLGITRFGLAKTRDSVLQLASFEKTADHLFAAAAALQSDPVHGVSELVIMGQTIGLGTGSVSVVKELKLQVGDLQKRPTVFEDAWEASVRPQKKMRGVHRLVL